MQIENAHTHSYCSGTDDQHLNATFSNGCDLGANRIDPVGIDFADTGCEDTRAEFDDDAFHWESGFGV